MGTSTRLPGDIMLVGSLPFETAEEGLRAVGSKLGGEDRKSVV